MAAGPPAGWRSIAPAGTEEGSRFFDLGDPGNLTIQKRRRSCRHSTRKPRLSAQQLVRCFAQCRCRSNVRQYQALFCLLTKRKPALVIRAAQLVLQESIVAIGVRHGAARQASPASGPKERPVADARNGRIAPIMSHRPANGPPLAARGFHPAFGLRPSSSAPDRRGVTRQGPLFARPLNNTRRTTRVARRPIGVMDPYHPVVRCHIYATAVGVRRYRYSR
jgi:hypothetical protein